MDEATETTSSKDFRHHPHFILIELLFFQYLNQKQKLPLKLFDNFQGSAFISFYQLDEVNTTCQFL